MNAAETDQLIEKFEVEAPMRTLPVRLSVFASALAIGISVYALYWVVAIVQPQVYRVSFLMVALVLTFLR